MTGGRTRDRRRGTESQGGTAVSRAAWGDDASTGLVVALGCVLIGAPVGLLWAAVTPRVDVDVTAAGPQLVDSGTTAFIAADGFFLALVLLAGVVTGLVAWRWQDRRGGPGLVLGLLLGGLLAAEVARRTGELVGIDAPREAVATGRQGVLELAVQLRSLPALVGWPVGALLAVGAATAARPQSADPAPLSSG